MWGWVALAGVGGNCSTMPWGSMVAELLLGPLLAWKSLVVVVVAGLAVVDGGASWVVGAGGSGCVTVTCAISHAVVPKVDGAWDEAAVKTLLTSSSTLVPFTLIFVVFPSAIFWSLMA